MVQKLSEFLMHGIWRVRARSLPLSRSLPLRALRILIVSAREFATDKCSLRASALTFYSLLSIVPVFAMAFGMAKGFGLDKMLKAKLIENMEGQGEVINKVIEFSENLLMNTSGGVIAGIGIGFLFWTVIKVLGNIEVSFNDIWGVKQSRSLGRKFADYLSLMLILPVFFLIASSATVFIVSQIQNITEQVALLGFFAPLLLKVVKLLPFVVFWGLLTYLYMFMPNTTIRFSSALLGGVVAGTFYQLVQGVYIHFQVGVAKAGAVYGSFAALPLFLMWLQVSWLIVLYGAELAFAHQNEQTFEFEPDCMNASQRIRKLYSLAVVHVCVKRFVAGLRPLSPEEIAGQLEMPIRLTRDIIFQLSKARVLSAIRGDTERMVGYQPARDIDDLSVRFVLESLDNAGIQDIPIVQTDEIAKFRECLDALEKNLEGQPENVLIKDVEAAQFQVSE